MRVIGGALRSRRLKSLPGLAIRPTPDRLRETLFDVLANQIEGAVFLDAYAGTGAVGIEALSRGAKRAIFVESDREAVRLIKENLAALGLEARSTVFASTAQAALPRYQADIVFLDPPYTAEREYAKALAVLAHKPPRLVILQHDKRLALQDCFGKLRRARTITQGDNALSFFTSGARTRA